VQTLIYQTHVRFGPGVTIATSALHVC
jgi:hypothetical protein